MLRLFFTQTQNLNSSNFMPSLTFRQAQCDFARCQSEPVEDCVLAIINDYANKALEITIRCTSEVPSYI